MKGDGDSFKAMQILRQRRNNNFSLGNIEPLEGEDAHTVDAISKQHMGGTNMMETFRKGYEQRHSGAGFGSFSMFADKENANKGHHISQELTPHEKSLLTGFMPRPNMSAGLQPIEGEDLGFFNRLSKELIKPKTELDALEQANMATTLAKKVSDGAKHVADVIPGGEGVGAISGHLSKLAKRVGIIGVAPDAYKGLMQGIEDGEGSKNKSFGAILAENLSKNVSDMVSAMHAAHTESMKGNSGMSSAHAVDAALKAVSLPVSTVVPSVTQSMGQMAGRLAGKEMDISGKSAAMEKAIADIGKDMLSSGMSRITESLQGPNRSEATKMLPPAKNDMDKGRQ